MHTSLKSSEQGQIIVVFVVTIVIMVALAALVIDGGNLYLNRRAAQTAADAAALAGAYEHCVNKGNLKEVRAVVDDYALLQNKATNVEDLNFSYNHVEVTVSITMPTFFAKIFGKSTEWVQAAASADCLPPRDVTGNVVPIAWTCRPPVGGNVGDCLVERIPHNIFKEIQDSGFDFNTNILDSGNKKTSASYKTDLEGYAGEGKALYIVMDTDKFNEKTDCQDYGGPIDCDLNNDGQIDVIAGGDRGWLYLEGNAANLVNVMHNGTSNTIPTNIWVPGKTGSDDVVMQTAHDYKIGDVVFIPVFDKICQTNNFYVDCDFDSSVDSVWEWSGQYTYYHIVEFAAFVMTCVYDNIQDSCPGRTYAGLNKNDANTIEGYFIDGYIYGGVPGDGLDLGVYVMTLTE